MRRDASEHQDVLWLQTPIGLVRSVVIAQTHGNLNKDELFLLSGYHFVVNLVRKANLIYQIVSRVVIRFFIIHGLFK